MTIFSLIEHISHNYPMKVKFTHNWPYFHTLSIFHTIILLLSIAVLIFWNSWLFHGGRCTSMELYWPMVFLAWSSRWRKEESHQIDQTLPHRRHFWLLLWMQRGAREEAPMKLYLAHGTFGTFMTISTIIACFVERGSRPSLASEPTTPSCKQGFRQYHDHLHPHRLFCKWGPARSEVRPAPRRSGGPKPAGGPPEGRRPGSGHVSAPEWWACK
jgi:hypothetical protein